MKSQLMSESQHKTTQPNPTQHNTTLHTDLRLELEQSWEQTTRVTPRQFGLRLRGRGSGRGGGRGGGSGSRGRGWGEVGERVFGGMQELCDAITSADHCMTRATFPGLRTFE
jgi:hypothetical protein